MQIERPWVYITQTASVIGPVPIQLSRAQGKIIIEIVSGVVNALASFYRKTIVVKKIACTIK